MLRNVQICFASIDRRLTQLVCSNAEVVHTGVQEVFWKNRRRKQQHPAALGEFVVVEDLRAVAKAVEGKKVASTVSAMIVPGSGLVKLQAEEEGLDKIFKAAGFEWREPGCSMCLAMNADRLEPGERCASTSNRNFEGRQGAGGRTHLVSPAMAAAAAIHGHFVDIRQFA